MRVERKRGKQSFEKSISTDRQTGRLEEQEEEEEEELTYLSTTAKAGVLHITDEYGPFCPVRVCLPTRPHDNLKHGIARAGPRNRIARGDDLDLQSCPALTALVLLLPRQCYKERGGRRYNGPRYGGKTGTGRSSILQGCVQDSGSCMKWRFSLQRVGSILTT